jgi:hypothetical protein
MQQRKVCGAAFIVGFKAPADTGLIVAVQTRP